MYSSRWRPAEALIATFVSFAALLWLADPPPLHPDSSRDLVLAADCALDGLCTTVGANTSHSGIYFGALWVDLLAAARLVGLGVTATFHLMLFGIALAVGANWLGGAALAGRTGAFMAAGSALAGFLVLFEDWLLWNPLLLPLPCTLLLCLTLRWVRNPQPWTQLLLIATTLAAALEAHPTALTLAAGVLLSVGVAAQKPIRSLLILVGVSAGIGQFVSTTALQRAMDTVSSSPDLPAHLFTATVAIATVFMARRFLPSRVRTHPDVVLLLLVAAAAAVITAWVIGTNRAPSPRYLVPVVPLAALGIAWVSQRVFHHHFRFAPSIVLVLVLAEVFLSQVGTRSTDIPWRLADVETLAAALEEEQWTYGEIWSQLEGPWCWELVAGLGPWMTLPLDSRAEEESTLRLERSDADGTIVLEGGRRATASIGPRRVGPSGRYCLDTTSGQTCVETLDYTALRDRSQSRFGWRQHPREVDLRVPGDEVKGISWTHPVRSGSHSTKLSTWSWPWTGCQWDFVGTNGFVVPENLPATSLTLPGGASGSVELALHCDNSRELQGSTNGFAPCLQESQ
jgi:hypothetical protein